MNNIQELLNYAQEKAKLYPEHQDEINDLVQLCIDEINEGGSTEHEIQLCMESINQLTNPEDDQDF